MKRVVTIVALLFAILSVNVAMVSAQSGNTWCYTFDLKSDSYSEYIVETPGQGAFFPSHTGDGLQSVDIGGTGEYNYWNLNLELSTITYLSVVHESSQTNFLSTTAIISRDYYSTEDEVFYALGTPINLASQLINKTHVFYDNPSGVYTNTIRHRAAAHLNNPHKWYVTEIYITGFGDEAFPELENECGLPDLYKPLSQYEIESSYDIDELQLMNNYISVVSYDTLPHTSFTTMAVARNTGAKVHNVIDGTVTTVREMTVSDCANFGLDGDQFFINNGVGPDGALVQASLGIDCSFLFESDVSVAFVISSLAQAVTNPLRDKYYVEIEGTDDLIYSYLVENADAYISDGLSVEGGCQIGDVLSVSSVGFELDVNPFSYALAEGFVFINSTEDDVAIPIADRMIEEPVNSQPCNDPSDHDSCVGDSLLDTPGQWSITGGGTWLPGGGIRLPAGARVYTNPPLVLDENRNPKLTIQGQSIGGSGQLTSSLGQTSEVFSLGSSLTQHVIAGDTHQPDAGDLYTVSHKNTGSNSIEVKVSCLSFTTLSDGSTPDPDDYDPPPACLFDNATFNDGTGSWFVTNAESGDGSIRLTTGGTITQARELVGDSDDFAVTVTSALWHYNTYTPDPANATGGVTIEYQINGGGWSTVDAEITYGSYAQNNNRVQVTDTFNTSTVSGDFQFRVTLASIPTGVRGVELLDVCINAGTDYDPDEEFPTPDGIGDFPPQPPFTESCRIITTPSGSDIGQWIYYHWSQLDNFFQCDLMRLLNALYDLIIQIYQTVGWAIRWMFAMIQQTWEWAASSFFPWLAGYLSNISPGQVVLQQEEQCNNLFCAITSMFDLLQSFLDLVNDLLQLVIDVVGAIIDIGLQLVSLILDMVRYAQLFFDSLVGSWLNATPIENPYLPSCSVNPQQNGLCIFLWLIENTVLSGTGALLIPLLISYGSITWLLFAAKEIKKVVLEAAQGL